MKNRKMKIFFKIKIKKKMKTIKKKQQTKLNKIE